MYACILGIAPCLEDDLNNLFKITVQNQFDFFAVGLNCSDRVLFPIKHAVSYHPKEFIEFRKRRKAVGGNFDYITHSHVSPCDRMWPLIDKSPFSGSSSFLASQVAVGLGYNKIILCGCPLQGNNLHSSNKNKYEVFQKGWIKHGTKVLGTNKVRSMSGWTKTFCGEPTKEWIEN